MTDLFTAEARPHIRGLLAALAPGAKHLERQFGAQLLRCGWSIPQVRALLAVAPTACAREKRLARFVQRVEYQGRRLAQLNVPPQNVLAALEQFGQQIDEALGGRFQPAREQLHLATRLVLDQAFYRVSESESQALLALSRAEVDAADLDDLLRRFVRVLVETFGASAGWLILMEPGIQRRLARPRCFGRFCQFGSVWSYPFGRSAVLQLAFATLRPWLPREQELLAAVAVRCDEALERARLEREVRRLEAESRQAEEEERRRIGRELHDEAGQALMYLRLQLEMMERAAPPGLRARLAEARELAAWTAVELRRIIAALSPSVLERLGLGAAVRQLAARFRAVHQARVRLQLRLPEPALPRAVQEVVYRVVQESLHNIARHSQATAVNLRLYGADKNIKLSVVDNGAGFCADQAGGNPKSFGLAGMRERAALLGGTLEVSSEPGQGTRITLELPLGSAQVNGNGKDSRIADGRSHLVPARRPDVVIGGSRPGNGRRSR